MGETERHPTDLRSIPQFKLGVGAPSRSTQRLEALAALWLDGLCIACQGELESVRAHVREMRPGHDGECSSMKGGVMRYRHKLCFWRTQESQFASSAASHKLGQTAWIKVKAGGNPRERRGDDKRTSRECQIERTTGGARTRNCVASTCRLSVRERGQTCSGHIFIHGPKSCPHVLSGSDMLVSLAAVASVGGRSFLFPGIRRLSRIYKVCISAALLRLTAPVIYEGERNCKGDARLLPLDSSNRWCALSVSWWPW